ncbi:hypothetical protein GCM10027589_41810 [Actinocorallia lasiicapitis]
MNGIRVGFFIGRASAVGAAVAIAVAGCGRDSAPRSPAVEVSAATASDGAGFFAKFRLEGARWHRAPAGLPDATKKARLVALAEVADVRSTRTIGEGNNAQPMIGIVLKNVEIIKGRPAPGLKEIVVELPGSPIVGSPEVVTALKSSLPQGRALWFLNWMGELPKGTKPKPGAPAPREEDKRFYCVIHPSGGLTVEGPDGLVTPLAEQDEADNKTQRQDLRHDISRYQNLKDLVAAVREAD